MESDINHIAISGVVTGPKSADSFIDEFLEWIESKGYTFGGGIGPYKDDTPDIETASPAY